MKNLKKFFALFLVISLIFPMFSITVKADEVRFATVSEVIKLLTKAITSDIDMSKSRPYVTKALELGIIKSNEFKDYNTKITREQTAILVARVCEINDIKYDNNIYNYVKKYKRIADISKATSGTKDSIYKVFSLGIMVGNSKGNFTQDRDFNPTDYLTYKDAKIIANRIKIPEKRKKMSFDGQVIRTTKLPSNADKYSYILESFPNDFYEMKFRYYFNQYYYTPVELKHYAQPSKVRSMRNYTFTQTDDKELEEYYNKYSLIWSNIIKKNLELRFNVNYKTINNKWINKLMKTYALANNSEIDGELSKSIKSYVNLMKKNKTIIKTANVVVEPSTLYYDGGYYLRAYVKYMIVSANSLGKASLNPEYFISDNLIFGDTGETQTSLKNPKINKWVESYFDLPIGSIFGGATIDDKGVLWEYASVLKEWYQKGSSN